MTAGEVFAEPWLHERTDLRLTLDEPADYELLRRVYAEVSHDEDVNGGALAVLADTSSDPPTRHTPLFRVKLESG